MAGTNISAELWIGPADLLHDEAISYIQKTTTTCMGCRFCSQCRAIEQKQWSRLIWVTPGSNGYTRDAVNEALLRMEFAIEEPHVVIIEQADMLTAASGQCLLKPLEEPFSGWHIILLTQCPSSIMPTIRSRCIERVIQSDASRAFEQFHNHATLAWLRKPTREGYSAACRSIGTLPTTLREASAICESLLMFWHQRQLDDAGDTRHARAMLNAIYVLSARPPATGGVTLFWRTLLCRVYSSLRSL